MKCVRPLSLFTDLLKAEKPRKLLGLNMGIGYVGLAVSDQQNKLASYLHFLLKNDNTEENIELMATKLQCLACEHSIEGFVVSYYPFDWRLVNSVAITSKFLDKLSKTRKLEGIKYTYWDTRFSTGNMGVVSEDLNSHPLETGFTLNRFSAFSMLQSMEIALSDVILHPLQSEYILNRFSAFSMLQDYLNYMNEKHEA